MESDKEKKAWKEVKYKERFKNAFRGMYVVVKATRHIWIHITSAVFVIILGFYFKISLFEWIAIVMCIGAVFVTEAFNTAIEMMMDMMTDKYHTLIKLIKDIAAAVVLLTSLNAVAVGYIIFIRKVFVR